MVSARCDLAGVGDYDLRPHCVDPAGVDVTHAARLFEHILEVGDGRCACHRGGTDSPDVANAGHNKIYWWERARFRRAGLPLRFYHDRLRRGFRFSFAHRFGHDAENAGTRIPDSRHRLWGNGDRNDGCVDGDDRCVCAFTGRILRDQYHRHSC